MLYPLIFHPIFKERVWGGRNLERLYRKPLPPGVPIGESWEISDRPTDTSVIANGPLAGRDLRWLVENQQKELFGRSLKGNDRFPLLVKILDAQERLSLQVHPPAHRARELGGEPKTEMWYIASAQPGAELYVGLKRGVDRRQFEQHLRAGSVEQCFHRVPVRTGDAIFLPSGRVHAIGAGLVIFEIQQNSDTTYRVFDWNRLGLDGKPRPLHVEESLASIDFSDFEPGLISSPWSGSGVLRVRQLVADPLFTIELVKSDGPADIAAESNQLQIIGVVSGELIMTATTGSAGATGKLGTDEVGTALSPGRFILLPAVLSNVSLRAAAPATWLRVIS